MLDEQVEESDGLLAWQDPSSNAAATCSIVSNAMAIKVFIGLRVEITSVQVCGQVLCQEAMPSAFSL